MSLLRLERDGAHDGPRALSSFAPLPWQQGAAARVPVDGALRAALFLIQAVSELAPSLLEVNRNAALIL